MSAAVSDITGKAEGWMTAVVTPLKGCVRQAVKDCKGGDKRLSILPQFLYMN